MKNATNTQIVTPLLHWYSQNARKLPWRENPTAYHVWLSEIMLQQTRVETVIPYYLRFLSAVPDIRALADAPLDTLYKLWEGLGYYSRVRNLHLAAQEVCARFGGQLPQNRGELLTLPGVGSYTAGAIVSIAFDAPAAAVDGNVLRVLARLTGDGRNILAPAVRRDFEDYVMALMPLAEHPGDLTQALIELGALVCVPSAPSCCSCPLKEHCAAFTQGRTGELPLREKAKARRVLPRTVFLLRDGALIAIVKNSARGLLGGLYAFPCAEGKLSQDEALAFASSLGCEPLRIRPLGEAKHVFTHLTWEMTGYEILIAPNAEFDAIWAKKEDIDEKYAMPSAFAYYLGFV